MHEQDIAIVRALVPIAWADDEFAKPEQEMLDALLEAYQATDLEKKSVHEFASKKKTLDDIELQELSSEDRRVLLQHAVLLTFCDGAQSAEELKLLQQLAEKLRIPPAEAQATMGAAAERAKKLLHLL